MYNLDLRKGKYPIIIKPNFGQPILINLRDFIDESGAFKKKVVFDALIIAIPGQSTKEILQSYHLNIFIQPILKERGEFTKRRGERYPLQIQEINKIKKLDFREYGVLKEEHCMVWDIFNTLLQIDDLFGERNVLYKIKFQVKNVKKIRKLLIKTSRSSLIFDIVHEIPNLIENKINYHAIAFFDKDWADFRFIHATDFHVARRNDFIAKFLKDKAKDRIRRYRSQKKKISSNAYFILTRDFEFRKEFQAENIEKLRYAKYNFNQNIRKLINYINERVKEKKLDFVLMTGDLVDYIDIARGNYQYENNFLVFIEILLGINRGLDKYPYFTEEEYINKEEILAPIFTLVGNHDYRKGHYSLRIAKAHKIFGMKHKDIKGYYDIKFFNYFTVIRSKDKFIKDYFKYLNPNLNYILKIGDEYNFIFIDTGHDSIADVHDLFSGGPSTKGIKDYQVDLLRSYIRLSHNEKIIIVMHTPPISPSLNALKQRKFKRLFKLDRKIEWRDFYENNLDKYLGDPRVDRLLNLKYQTIMYNWATLLKIFTGSDKIIRRKVDLVLCGHTHTLKEFRLKEARETERINFGYFFFPIYVKIPCEIYTNRYRDFFKKFRDLKELKIWFDVDKPFVFQTQAIGPISLKYKFKAPGFRYYKIKNDQIVAANVYSLHLIDLPKTSRSKMELEDQIKT
ncbi:MAG: metallophosphoesterase [Candidatus Thorarchaeota archaeon]